MEDPWAQFTAFLQRHEIEIRQMRRGGIDRLYNAAVEEFGERIRPRKTTFADIISFYRNFNELPRIYCNNPHYTPIILRTPTQQLPNPEQTQPNQEPV